MSEPVQLTTVRLMDSAYKVACPPQELTDLQSAASFLNERFAEVRAGGRVVGAEHVAAMAGLNLAYDYLKLVHEINAERELLREQTARLLSQTEAALSKMSEAPL